MYGALTVGRVGNSRLLYIQENESLSNWGDRAQQLDQFLDTSQGLYAVSSTLSFYCFDPEGKSFLIGREVVGHCDLEDHPLFHLHDFVASETWQLSLPVFYRLTLQDVQKAWQEALSQLRQQKLPLKNYWRIKIGGGLQSNQIFDFPVSLEFFKDLSQNE